jgi:hypothetical protein
VKSTAVYRTLRAIVGPWCKTNGFRRTPGGMLGWYAPAGEDSYIAFWFQCSRDGYDPWAGSKFVVELQQSDSTQIGTGRHRMRIGRLIDDATRATVHALQNEIIARLPRPPKSHVAFNDPSTAKWYQQKFEPEAPYDERHDLWFRYQNEDDVKRWGQLILVHLPDAVARFTAAR